MADGDRIELNLCIKLKKQTLRKLEARPESKKLISDLKYLDKEIERLGGNKK